MQFLVTRQNYRNTQFSSSKMLETPEQKLLPTAPIDGASEGVHLEVAALNRSRHTKKKIACADGVPAFKEPKPKSTDYLQRLLVYGEPYDHGLDLLRTT